MCIRVFKILINITRYDWWDLASAWGNGGAASKEIKGPQAQVNYLLYVDVFGSFLIMEKWVGELMDENGIRALPRSPETLGRALDSREFWYTFGLQPIKARVNL